MARNFFVRKHFIFFFIGILAFAFWSCSEKEKTSQDQTSLTITFEKNTLAENAQGLCSFEGFEGYHVKHLSLQLSGDSLGADYQIHTATISKDGNGNCTFSGPSITIPKKVYADLLVEAVFSGTSTSANPLKVFPILAGRKHFSITNPADAFTIEGITLYPAGHLEIQVTPSIPEGVIPGGVQVYAVIDSARNDEFVKAIASDFFDQTKDGNPAYLLKSDKNRPHRYFGVIPSGGYRVYVYHPNGEILNISENRSLFIDTASKIFAITRLHSCIENADISNLEVNIDPGSVETATVGGSLAYLYNITIRAKSCSDPTEFVDLANIAPKNSTAFLDFTIIPSNTEAKYCGATFHDTRNNSYYLGYNPQMSAQAGDANGLVNNGDNSFSFSSTTTGENAMYRVAISTNANEVIPGCNIDIFASLRIQDNYGNNNYFHFTAHDSELIGDTDNPVGNTDSPLVAKIIPMYLHHFDSPENGDITRLLVKNTNAPGHILLLKVFEPRSPININTTSNESLFLTFEDENVAQSVYMPSTVQLARGEYFQPWAIDLIRLDLFTSGFFITNLIVQDGETTYTIPISVYLQ